MIKQAISESEKVKLSDIYCKGICRLYKDGVINDQDIDQIMEDIDTLKQIVSLYFWRDLVTLKPEKMKEIIGESLKDVIKNKVTRDWIIAHIDNDHFQVIEKSVYRFANYVNAIEVEYPSYVDVIERDRKKRMTEQIRTLFGGGSKILVIKFKELSIKESDSTRIKLANENAFEAKIMAPVED